MNLQPSDRVEFTRESPMHRAGFRRGLVTTVDETIRQAAERIAPAIGKMPAELKVNTRATNDPTWKPIRAGKGA